MVVLVAGLGQVAIAADERKEPPPVLYFDLDGKHVPVEIDKPFPPTLLAGAKSSTLRMEPWRQFACGGVKLRYPREFTFEAVENSPGVVMWTLSGNDAKFMLFRYQDQSNPTEVQKSLVDGLMKAYRSGAKNQAPTTLDVAGYKLKGTRIDVEIAGTKLSQSVFSVRASADVVVLVLQDTPTEAGQPTPEWSRMMQMLDGSLKLPNETGPR